MKEFEFEFDDEIFEESNCRTNRVQGAYKPKQCDPEWFMQLCSNDDQSDRQTIRKYQGDLLYQKQKYQQALAMYQECQHCVSLNNGVLSREIMESMAMCLLKLQKFDDALTLVTETMCDSQHNDSSTWHLLSRIYRAMGNIQGEIDALQRCATFHSWNYDYWFSLALAYEKASASATCVQCQDCDPSKHFLLHQDLSEKNCKEKSLNAEYSQNADLTIKLVGCCCCITNGKTQQAVCSKHCDSNEEQTRRHLEHVVVGEQDTLPKHIYCSDCHSPFTTQSGYKSEVQEHTNTIFCLNRTFSDSTKSNSNPALVLSGKEQPLVHEVLCNCLTIIKTSVEDKLQWRSHVLSFGCLIKTRFFLEKAVEASSSFVKDKCKTFLREVNDKISTHTDCGCVHLSDKVLEMLYTSFIASEQETPDVDLSDTRTKGWKQLENPASAASDFEQKWFGDLLCYMSGAS